MKPKKIIGLCGRAGSGKSSVAAMLDGQMVSFAKPLKDMLATLGLTYAQLYGDQKEVPTDLLGGRTPRHAMLMLGTEWGRDLIWKDLWKFHWRRRVINSLHDAVICDDVRFPNEVDLIREMGGIVIAIDRPGLVQGTHLSEQLDYAAQGIIVVENTGTLEELRLKIQSLIEYA